MRILITSYRPLGYGGAEISVSLLAKGLNKLGNKVIIASTEKFGGFECKLFKKFEKLPFKFHEIYLKHFLINIIKKEKIDVIYSQDRLTSIGAILAHTVSQLVFIPRAERFLEESYGEHYLHYKKTVKRI